MTRLLRPAVLGLLAQESLHGYMVVERLTELSLFAGRPPEHSSVYRALQAMEAERIVRSHWDESRGGPARHVFEITDAGLACLANWRETLRRYDEALRDLLRRLDATLDVEEGS